MTGLYIASIMAYATCVLCAWGTYKFHHITIADPLDNFKIIAHGTFMMLCLLFWHMGLVLVTVAITLQVVTPNGAG